jgi:hypothetical protein
VPSLARSTSSGLASVSIVCTLSFTGGYLASPKIGEREAAAELLARAARTGALRPGLILIGDKGFAGRDFEDLLSAGFGISLARPDRRVETPRHGSIGWIRQWIESVNDTLNGQRDLERHGGRTAEGEDGEFLPALLQVGDRDPDMPAAFHDQLLSAQSVSG